MHTYRDVIQNVQWMDAETKYAPLHSWNCIPMFYYCPATRIYHICRRKIALHKLGAVTYKLGYPDWLLTDHDTYFIK